MFAYSDNEGRIHLNGFELTQRESIELAKSLTRAVDTSVHVNQVARMDSEEILRRQNSRIGRALTALERVYGNLGDDAWKAV